MKIVLWIMAGVMWLAFLIDLAKPGMGGELAFLGAGILMGLGYVIHIQKKAISKP